MNALFSTFESAGPFLWQTGLRGLLIFVVAIGAVIFLRRRSAAVRHLVWTASLLAALALPVLSLAIPPWRILNMPPMIEPPSSFPRHERPDSTRPVIHGHFESSAPTETEMVRGTPATVLPTNQPINPPPEDFGRRIESSISGVHHLAGRGAGGPRSKSARMVARARPLPTDSETRGSGMVGVARRIEG